MAQIRVVELIDDLDGTEATHTVNFALAGVEYEIDLNEENAAGLRTALGRFTEKARRVGGRKRTGTAAGTASGPSSKDIRSWARAQGLEINSRGRIQSSVVEQYLAAN